MCGGDYDLGAYGTLLVDACHHGGNDRHQRADIAWQLEAYADAEKKTIDLSKK